MRALHQHALPVDDCPVDDQRRVREVRSQPLRVALVARRELLELDRRLAVHALEPKVLLGERDLDLLAKDLRLEEILKADPEPVRLVRICRPDAAAGGADLELAEATLARAVDRQMPRHDHVRVPGEPDELGRDPARLELLELLDEDAGVDDAARADHALLAPQDPRGHVARLVRLAVDDDRVPGVRPAVVAANQIRVAGKQIDDLALALVAPLGADDDGTGHGRTV